MQVVQQAAKFGRNDVRNIKFVARRRSVKVICKGLPTMIVKPCDDTDKACFEAAITLPNGKEKYVTARTARAAYRQGVRQLWK